MKADHFSLKNQLKKAAIWTAAGQFGSAFLQWAQLAALAWMLPPADFGAMAVAQTAAGFAAPLTDLGLHQAVVFQPKLTENQRSTLFLVNFGVGAFFFLTFLGLGFWFADWFEEPRLTKLMGLVGVVFLMIPLGSERAALLTKNLEFGILSRLEMGARAASFLVSVGGAAAGWSVFSLAAGHLARHVFLLAGFVFFGKKFVEKPVRLGFFWGETRPLLRLGLADSGTRLVNFAQTNLDKFIVGNWLGLAGLGVYQLAWNFVVAPTTFVLPAVSRIAEPVFAKIQQMDAKKVSLAYGHTMLAATFLMMPIYAFLGVAASECVLVFFGEKWWAAAAPLQILAGAWAIRSTGVLGGALMLARRRPSLNFWWNVIYGIVTNGLLAFFLSLSQTAVSAAWALLLTNLAIFWIWHWVIWRFGEINYRDFLPDLTRTAMAAFFAFLASWLINLLDFGPFLSFAVKFLVGAMVYFYGIKKFGILKKLRDLIRVDSFLPPEKLLADENA